MKKLLLLPILLILSSCYTANKAMRQVYKAQAYHPEAVQKVCGEIYRPVDSTHIIETIIAGDTLVFTDTLREYHTDTVNNISFKYINRNVLIHDTLKVTQYVQVANKAMEIRLQTENVNLKMQVATLTKGRNTWRIISIVSLAVIGLWTVRKFIV